MTQGKKINVAILASGNGTNAQNLIRFFKNHESINITLVISNKPEAYVLHRALIEKVSSEVILNHQWSDKSLVTAVLQKYNVNLLVLAGFLVLVPEWLVNMYHRKIINIHPALLPAYGGKGMYGAKVHEAVLAAGDKVSGITIHYVNEKYDQGDIIFKKECQVFETDTPESLASRIHALEYEYYPKIVQQIAMASSMMRKIYPQT